MKLPPEYNLTGKKDQWYLERVVQDQWDPFDSEEEAIAAAREDWERINAQEIERIRRKTLREIITNMPHHPQLVGAREYFLAWLRAGEP